MMRTSRSLIPDWMPDRLAPTSPGEMLNEEFLKPLNLSVEAFAGYVRVAPSAVQDIIDGQAMDPAMLLRIAQATNMSPRFWSSSNEAYVIARAMTEELVAELRTIKPLPGLDVTGFHRDNPQGNVIDG